MNPLCLLPLVLSLSVAEPPPGPAGESDAPRGARVITAGGSNGARDRIQKKLERMPDADVDALVARFRAGEPLSEEEQALARAASNALKRSFAKDLNFREGSIELPGIGILNLPEDLRFLDPGDATKVIGMLWGNAPRNDVVGMLVSKSASLMSPQNGWAIVISRDAKGLVDDSGADALDTDALLARLQRAARRASEASKEKGGATMELAGWVRAPAYEASTRALHWSEEVISSRDAGSLLNHRTFVLTAEGALAFEAVAPRGLQTDVESTMDALPGYIALDASMRYPDGGAASAPRDLAGVVLGLRGRAGGGFPWEALLGGVLALTVGLGVGAGIRRSRGEAGQSQRAT